MKVAQTVLPLDSKVLETRLLTKESGIANSTLAKCAIQLNKIIQSRTGEIDKIDACALDSFVREVIQVKLEMTKMSKAVRASEIQIESFKKIESEIEDKILSTQGQIAALEIELEQEQLIRAHRETLEEKSVHVNALPTRSSLKRKIDAVDDDLKTVNEALQKSDNRIQQRHKQFVGMLLSMTELQSKLKEDDEIVLEPDNDGVDEEVEDYERERHGDSREERVVLESLTNDDVVEGDDVVATEADLEMVITSEETAMETSVVEAEAVATDECV